jgi:hypothetical protein
MDNICEILSNKLQMCFDKTVFGQYDIDRTLLVVQYNGRYGNDYSFTPSHI